jgi:subtilase family serine protease
MRAVSYPGSDPWVTSVGGTSLAIGRRGGYEETGWGDRATGLTSDGKAWANPPGSFGPGSGGGASSLFTQPSYQRGVVPTALGHANGAAPVRAVPDIAAAADPATDAEECQPRRRDHERDRRRFAALGD